MSKKRKYEITLITEMESSLKKVFGGMEKSLNSLEQDLKDIAASDPFHKIADNADDSKAKVEALKKASDEFGKSIKAFKDNPFIKMGTTAAKNLVGAMTEQEAAFSQIRAATGLTAKDMAQIEEAVNGLYLSGLGDSFNELSSAVTLIKQSTRAQGKELENLTRNAIIYKDVFGGDVASSVASADRLMQAFGISADEAFNLMAQGTRKGLNQTGELMGAIHEFSPQFSNLGISANEMFDLFASAFSGDGLDVGRIGGVVEEMGILMDNGGKTNAWKDALAGVNREFDMSRNTMAEIASIKYDNLQSEWTKFGRELQSEFLIPMAEGVLPVLRDLTEWATQNTGLLKNLMVVFGGGVVAKGAANIAGSFGKMYQAAMNATTGTGQATTGMKAFGLASGLLGGPVGIGITALSAITLGVMEFKRHQEEARQSLLNMGAGIEEAFNDYQGIAEHRDKVTELIGEYDQLQTVIGNAKTPSEDLEAARRRLLEVEELLIQLNPEILSAEDAKTGKFREQLGWVEQRVEAESEMAKRELEKAFIDGQSKLPDLEKEYEKLQKKAEKFEQQNEDAFNSYKKYSEFIIEHESILKNSNLTGDQRDAKIAELEQRVEEETGQYMADWRYMEAEAKKFDKKYRSSKESLKEATDELNSADQSFQSIYNTAKAKIEMDLGESIESMTARFGELTEAEKAAMYQAVEQINLLNQELDMLPDFHKINVQFVYEQLAGTANLPNSIKRKYLVDTYADGGFASRPSIFGEAGLEAAIPINNKQRSHALLDRVNQIMGHDNGGGMTQVTFAPVIHIQGGGANTAQQVQQAMEGEQERFKRWFMQMRQQERRLAF